MGFRKRRDGRGGDGHRCGICRTAPGTFSAGVGVCPDCLRRDPERAVEIALSVHRAHRLADGLPAAPPRDPGGRPCRICANECVIGPEGRGYCAIRIHRHGRLTGGTRWAGVSWYHDPLPTNCVADWVCAGGTGAGYPRWAHRPGPEHGWENLAVFSHACGFDCAFCQNGDYRRLCLSPVRRTPAEIAGAVGPATSCICFFGGDPGPQMPAFLRAARLALERRPAGILRICWETNGSCHPALLEAALDLSLRSGGCVKFDLKAWSPSVHQALTGAHNRRTLDNITRAARRIPERPVPPPVVVSTLLVPGYVDDREVGRIARFLAALDPSIPYALLAFHPQLYMRDLPPTSRAQAEACLAAARGAGLIRVRVGNEHLLW